MNKQVTVVKMAELRLAENSTLLKTTLGSCVAVILHDTRRAVGGMAHFMLPERLGVDMVIGKYADTAIPALLSRMLKRGSRLQDIRACLAGGANMFKASGDLQITAIGEKNVQAARRILGQLQIPLAYEDTGGERGRTVLFNTHTGEVQVRFLNKVAGRGEQP